MEWDAFTVFSADTESLPAVRTWLGQQLRWRDVDADTAYLVQVLVSELATNAVRHTNSSLIEVRLSVGTVIEASVRDQDPSGLIQACQPGLDEVSGRGLAIVDALSDAWGTYRDDTGKWVWFRFDPTVDRR